MIESSVHANVFKAYNKVMNIAIDNVDQVQCDLAVNLLNNNPKENDSSPVVEKLNIDNEDPPQEQQEVTESPSAEHTEDNSGNHTEEPAVQPIVDQRILDFFNNSPFMYEATIEIPLTLRKSSNIPASSTSQENEEKEEKEVSNVVDNHIEVLPCAPTNAVHSVDSLNFNEDQLHAIEEEVAQASFARPAQDIDNLLQRPGPVEKPYTIRSYDDGEDDYFSAQEANIGLNVNQDWYSQPVKFRHYLEMLSDTEKVKLIIQEKFNPDFVTALLTVMPEIVSSQYLLTNCPKSIDYIDLLVNNLTKAGKLITDAEDIANLFVTLTPNIGQRLGVIQQVPPLRTINDIDTAVCFQLYLLSRLALHIQRPFTEDEFEEVSSRIGFKFHELTEAERKIVLEQCDLVIQPDNTVKRPVVSTSLYYDNFAVYNNTVTTPKFNIYLKERNVRRNSKKLQSRSSQEQQEETYEGPVYFGGYQPTTIPTNNPLSYTRQSTFEIPSTVNVAAKQQKNLTLLLSGNAQRYVRRRNGICIIDSTSISSDNEEPSDDTDHVSGVMTRLRAGLQRMRILNDTTSSASSQHVTSADVSTRKRMRPVPEGFKLISSDCVDENIIILYLMYSVNKRLVASIKPMKSFVFPRFNICNYITDMTTSLLIQMQTKATDVLSYCARYLPSVTIQWPDYEDQDDIDDQISKKNN